MTVRLSTRRVEKPWGRAVLPAPFADETGARIGEIWFDPPPSLPQLLVKYIFTSEKLSVQVHPSDEQAPGHGKEECWLVIDADPGAMIGIGFADEVGAATMRAAAIDGSIEALMIWYSVRPGDFFYIPAGTVHAIGAGISLIEIQQNSDVTYRLYDYGRPRELRLEDGLAVARGTPYPAGLRLTVPQRGAMVLVDGPLFRVDQVAGVPDAQAARRYHGPLLLIPREGGVRISGVDVMPGECGLAPELDAVEFSSGAVCLIAQPCAS